MTSDQEAIASDFDRVAAAYDGLRAARRYDEALLDCVPATADTVLEVGCGGGTLLKRLGKRHRRVYGCDISDEMLRLARAKVEAQDNVTIWKCPVENILERIRIESCDAIVAERVLHHCKDLVFIARILRDSLRLGGRVIILDIETLGGSGKLESRVKTCGTNLTYTLETIARGASDGRLISVLREVIQERQFYRSSDWKLHCSREPNFRFDDLEHAFNMVDFSIESWRADSKFRLLVAEKT